jgi:hypothetical protein
MDEQWMASLFQFPQKDCRELFSVFDESLREGDREGRGGQRERDSEPTYGGLLWGEGKLETAMRCLEILSWISSSASHNRRIQHYKIKKTSDRKAGETRRRRGRPATFDEQVNSTEKKTSRGIYCSSLR